MYNNVCEYLEQSAMRVGHRTAIWTDNEKLTYKELDELSRRIGSAILARKPDKKIIVLLLHPRSIWNFPGIWGTLYAGCAYAPLDTGMPSDTLKIILERLCPGMILLDDAGKKAFQKLEGVEVPVLSIEEAANAGIQEELLKEARRQASLYDPVSILFTSGTTGIPKGSVQNHFSYLHWTEATIQKYGFDETIRFGNQSSFFYANSVIDIYPPIALGASVYLLPPGILTFPQKMVECLNKHQISELTMTPSSFTGIANSGALEENKLPYLKYGIMSGEAMPAGPLKKWMEASQNAQWWYFYGSTEMFSVAVDRVSPEALEQGTYTVGVPFSFVHILFLDEEGRKTAKGEPGEMYVSSPWIAGGYYRDPERTMQAWIVDPLENGWHERFYRSGDIGMLSENGELMVMGRKDSQVKHMGYRMELGEVETALLMLEGVLEGCVLFQKESGKIWAFYTGTPQEKEILQGLKKKLSAYMIPEHAVKLSEMPHTATMKINRSELRKQMTNE